MKKTVFTPHRTLLAVAISMAAMTPTQALEFYSGGLEGSFDSSISVGSSWRVEAPSDEIISRTTNGNDGNANFKKGDAISQVFKGSHDLQLSFENYGAFVRAKYWTDLALDGKEGDVPNAANGAGTSTVNQNFNSDEFNDLSKTSGYALLDAFVYGEFEVMDMPLDLRLGKQVISWGESTFIMGGINNINPFDVNEFTRPGATLKEGLLPVNMAYASMGLTDSLSAEAFYQLEFQETVIPGCGTYFATNDYAPEGCFSAIGVPGLPVVGRATDDKPDADGQFGIALRYVSESLGDTEFGFYAMNVHSRLPVASGIKRAGYQTIQETAGDVGAALMNNLGNEAIHYQVSYPEDQKLMAVSFATNMGTMAVSGEVTHKLDVPLQLNATQILGAIMVGGASANAEIMADVIATPIGEVIEGYRLFDVSQVQVTAIKLIDQVGPISRITLIGEAGYTLVHDLPDADVAGNWQFDGNAVEGLDGTESGFVTESSWGYRGLAIANFTDVFAGVNLQTKLSLAHDVEGYSPAPGGNFKEGQVKAGFTLKADYLSTYSASISYTDYSGGVTNNVSDRDFAAITLGMSF